MVFGKYLKTLFITVSIDVQIQMINLDFVWSKDGQNDINSCSHEMIFHSDVIYFVTFPIQIYSFVLIYHLLIILASEP